MTKKYETAANISVSGALYAYKNGIATIVTDGKYVQAEKEKEVK